MSISESDSSDEQPRVKDKIEIASSLPTVAVYNFRSLFPKIENAKADILERNISVAFCCEIWEKPGDEKQSYEIEKMCEINGLKYISSPRSKNWGGAAIIVDCNRFSIEKLDVNVPKNLEVVWGLLTCKADTARFKNIILCSFYNSPKSRRGQKLADYLVTTLHMLTSIYPETPVILGADKNRMDIEPLLKCGLRLKQVVDVATRKNSILDVIIMNISQYYNSPVVVPPVPCDNPKDGVPSDHWVPVCYPHVDRHNPPLRRFRTVTYRPLSADSLREFGKWISGINFDGFAASDSATVHAEKLQSLLISALDTFCPTKTMRVGNSDKPFINQELKTLKRRKQREYVKNGKSLKYRKLAEEFSTNYKAAAEKYIRKKVDDLKETKPGKAFSILRNMGAKPGDDIDGNQFTLPLHEGLTKEESAEKIAQAFASISNEYLPLKASELPKRVKDRLNDGTTPPIISELECYHRIRTAKKPKSVIPGDLPSSVLNEFSVELAGPLSDLLNKIIRTAEWPKEYKVEHITPISKIAEPKSEDDLRPISLTHSFSKILEQFIVSWLLDHIGLKMDFRQYGGTKGNSVCHYLIEFLNFILYQLESGSKAVLACVVDFSKAFNRQDHQILIEKLCDLGTPGWLLRLVVAFLEDRTMKVKYKGIYSSLFDLPGGGPQGTLLGLFLFLILINDVGFPGQKNNAGEIITAKKKVKELNVIHLKYIDDLTLAEGIDMDSLKHVGVEERPQPDAFRCRTGHQLEPSKSELLAQIDKIQEYSIENKMKINADKTNLILFNPCRSKDFLPNKSLQGSDIKTVESVKLLGVTITSNFSWDENTKLIAKKCYERMWILKRLKNLGANKHDLLEVYVKQIRCIAEYAVPAWNSFLTGRNAIRLERIQKTALHIIMGNEYNSYTRALNTMSLQRLTDRRKKLCLNFALKCEKNPKFSNWFKLNLKYRKSRHQQPKYCEVYTRTERFYKSPIAYLTRLLNEHYRKP